MGIDCFRMSTRASARESNMLCGYVIYIEQILIVSSSHLFLLYVLTSDGAKHCCEVDSSKFLIADSPFVLSPLFEYAFTFSSQLAKLISIELKFWL